MFKKQRCKVLRVFTMGSGKQTMSIIFIYIILVKQYVHFI